MAEVPITAVISAFQNLPCLPLAHFPFCIQSLLCLNGLPEPGHCVTSCPTLRPEFISSSALGAGRQGEVPISQ